MCQRNTRLLICSQCRDFIQMPNPEQGDCKILQHAVNYDSRCLLGLYVHIKCPDLMEYESEREIIFDKNRFEELIDLDKEDLIQKIIDLEKNSK